MTMSTKLLLMLIPKKNLLWFIPITIIAVLFSLPVLSTELLNRVIDFIKIYPVVAPLVIVFFRFIGIVLAPLPGAPISFASIAILPWWEAWIYNLIGAELGVIAAFLIARKFREPIVARFAPLQKVHEWQDRISKRKQFWSFVGLRLTALVAFDFVSYAAGLTKLRFISFILACLLIDIPSSFLFFLFGGIAFQYSVFLFAGFIVIFLITALIWKYKSKAVAY